MKARWLLLSLFVVSFSAFAFAGANCNTATVLNADGRILDFDFVAPTNPPGLNINYYQFAVTAGRSYSVEVRQDYDDLQPGPDITTAAFTDNGCVTALTGTNNTTNNDPVLPGNSQRFSFTAAATGNVYLKLTNGNASQGRYVSITVAETTLFSPRWSTVAGFETQWGFQNTTSQPVSVSMVIGTTPPTVVPPFTVPAGGVVIRSTKASDLNIANEKVGAAVATHNGPPGAIVADSYFLNGSATVVVPATVNAPRLASH